MKVIFKCKNQNQDYEDIYIYLNNEQNEFKYVGNLNILLDFCEMDVECTDEELNLCMNLFNSLCNNIHLTFNEWTQNFEIHKEEKLDEQCNFNLPQKLTYHRIRSDSAYNTTNRNFVPLLLSRYYAPPQQDSQNNR